MEVHRTTMQALRAQVEIFERTLQVPEMTQWLDYLETMFGNEPVREDEADLVLGSEGSQEAYLVGEILRNQFLEVRDGLNRIVETARTAPDRAPADQQALSEEQATRSHILNGRRRGTYLENIAPIDGGTQAKLGYIAREVAKY
jgi:hypothetical protein